MALTSEDRYTQNVESLPSPHSKLLNMLLRLGHDEDAKECDWNGNHRNEPKHPRPTSILDEYRTNDQPKSFEQFHQ